MWVSTGSFSAITVRTNSYPRIDPCSASFSLPDLTDGFNTFPSSSIHRTSIVNSGKVIGPGSSPFTPPLNSGNSTVGGSIKLLFPSTPFDEIGFVYSGMSV